ncbi:hypothetical protein [Alteribacillus bidgolensis]|uniref:C1q domain-containing protein n=1 Tax=Alteribacillus bidgolensis TaxID=930129 RepID=A0A1G8FPU8_9BACI|nr:hypothetical protein [Alteribacillus bidgolensis]SDH83946.1 hypothetical protein SAMN05216352_10328 [Alteribacillus bidgolensis]
MGVRNNKTRISAFRAIGTQQLIPANTVTKVNFPTERFDAAGEYDPATSTFIPETDGVYNIIATVNFIPNFNDRDINFVARVNIRLNGNFVIGVDTSYRLAGNVAGQQNPPNIVNASTVVELQAGDRVDVTAQSSRAVNISPSIGAEENIDATFFAAARFPSRAI